MARKLDVHYVNYYTSGTAARNIQSAFPVTAPPKPKKKRMKRVKVYVDPVAVLGIVVAIAMMISMSVGISRLSQVQKSNAQLQGYVDQLTRSNEILTEEYKGSYDLAQVEQTALAMGMIPQEQAPRTTIHVDVPQTQVQVSLWERIGTFLMGLFA